MEHMRLDEKLRTLCARRRITPTELGREAGGIPKTTMYNWSNGVSRPDLDSALKIARYFGVPLDYLADDDLDDPPTPALSADELAVVDQFRALGLTRAEAIRALAAAYSGRGPAQAGADREPLVVEDLMPPKRRKGAG